MRYPYPRFCLCASLGPNLLFQASSTRKGYSGSVYKSWEFVSAFQKDFLVYVYMYICINK